ncbi:unnamed protein product [[Candida] boidinii]|uniref:Unnamed protein product n=1 Tax=Candida boidinii TaxID=5477 RepID=A0A9W6WHK4_CANBO|nr:unnamed protein product [[Candida] boidinii]GME98598.1 unnamed protein product [[Candida] boidinii]GMF64101.1 unnamed protein product [[Candida] boidinii]GMG05472.1 unnamed protein product [[Candida] boidinii]
MAIKIHQLVTVILFSGIGVYTGVKFFEPLVIDQLRRDGNLRDDIKIPEYDPEGNPIVNGRSTGETWDKLRQRLEAPAEEKADIQVLPDTKTGKK